MWLRSKADNDGYFSLQNSISGIYLTAESETETVIGDLGNLTYPNKMDLNEIMGPKYRSVQKLCLMPKTSGKP